MLNMSSNKRYASRRLFEWFYESIRKQMADNGFSIKLWMRLEPCFQS